MAGTEAWTSPEAMEKAAVDKAAGGEAEDQTADSLHALEEVQSLRLIRTFPENEVLIEVIDSIDSPDVPGQVPSELEEVPVPKCGQGPPPDKLEPTLPCKPEAILLEPQIAKAQGFQVTSEDEHWQRHQEHLAYLKSLGSDTYNMAVEDTEGLSPPQAKDEVDDTTCTPPTSQQGISFLKFVGETPHVGIDERDLSETASVRESKMEVVRLGPDPKESPPGSGPRNTTPGRGLRERGIEGPAGLPLTTVENLSQAQDQEIWLKLKRQLQNLEESIGEIARKSMPKPNPNLNLTQSHPSRPKEAILGGPLWQGHLRALPMMSPMARPQSQTFDDGASASSTYSELSSSVAQGHSSRASVQSLVEAQQGSMVPDQAVPGMQGRPASRMRCLPASCESRSTNSLASIEQVPYTPGSAKIMSRLSLPVGVVGTPGASAGARTPAVSPGYAVFRQISSPVAVVTPRISVDRANLGALGQPVDYSQ